MSVQSSDPRSLFEPKPGWSEVTGPDRFRIMYSMDETRLLYAQHAVYPEENAYLRWVERFLEREGLAFVALDAKTNQRVAHGIEGTA